MAGLETFYRSYIRTALCCSTNDYGDFLIRKFSEKDLAEKSAVEALAQCKEFWEENPECALSPVKAGEDFFLDRNLFLSNFVDRKDTYGGYEIAKRLEANARKKGRAWLCVGYRNRLFFVYPRKAQ